MNFNPGEFFIKLLDFFTILLPGALLAYCLPSSSSAARLLPKSIERMSEAEQWAVLFAASYLLGHLLFLVGSWLDEVYDFASKWTREYRIRRLWRTKHLPSRFWRALLWLVFKREDGIAVKRATQIREKQLAPFAAQSAVNTFQWAKVRLALDNPAGLEIIQRFEADSKFFRSLVPLLLLLPLVRNEKSYYFLWLLIPLALWRYMEQRHKATKQAYWFLLALERSDPQREKSDEAHSLLPFHVGGVVYRPRTDGCVEYLLVEDSRRPCKWVLPEGRIETGEEPEQTAIRVVQQETRVWAEIERELKTLSFEQNGAKIFVRFFLMRCREEPWRKDRMRPYKWLVVDQKVDEASHPGSKHLMELLGQAEMASSQPAGR